MSRPHATSLRCTWVGGAVLAITTLGCSTSSNAGAGTGAASGPCDPLSPPPTSLGVILGVGEDTQSIFYVADEVPDSGQDRVFVSNGNTLDRQHVAGSGQSGGSPNSDYTFSFQAPSADAGDTTALLIQTRGGTVTGMALGPGNSRNFFGAPDASQAPLTVVDASVIAVFTIQNLPNVVQYAIDVSNGDAVVITAPMDAYDYTTSRLFYGTPSKMIERPITAYNQSKSGPADISFSVGATTYTLHTTFVYGPDAGPLGSPGPATLDTGGTLPATLRLPTPTLLSGFSFTCLDP
jgi:hypothetical protein